MPETTPPNTADAGLEVRRTRVAMVIVLVLAVLGAPLTFYATREAARDPVFGHLSELAVPGWAARDARDEATGSRWCSRSMTNNATPAKIAPIAAMGCNVPISLLACITLTSTVFDRIAARTASGSIQPRLSGTISVTCAPRSRAS